MPVQIYISNLHCERYVAMRIVIVRLECSFVGATAFLMYSVAQNKPHYLTFQLSSRKFVLNDRVTTWLGGHAARNSSIVSYRIVLYCIRESYTPGTHRVPLHLVTS